MLRFKPLTLRRVSRVNNGCLFGLAFECTAAHTWLGHSAWTKVQPGNFDSMRLSKTSPVRLEVRLPRLETQVGMR